MAATGHSSDSKAIRRSKRFIDDLVNSFKGQGSRVKGIGYRV
jgi:hypothetical protein